MTLVNTYTYIQTDRHKHKHTHKHTHTHTHPYTHTHTHIYIYIYIYIYTHTYILTNFIVTRFKTWNFALDYASQKVQETAGYELYSHALAYVNINLKGDGIITIQRNEDVF